MSDLERTINDAFERRSEFTPTRHDADVRDAVEQAIGMLARRKPQAAVLHRVRIDGDQAGNVQRAESLIRGGILMRCARLRLPVSKNEWISVSSDHLAMNDEPLATDCESPLTTM